MLTRHDHTRHRQHRLAGLAQPYVAEGTGRIGSRESLPVCGKKSGIEILDKPTIELRPQRDPFEMDRRIEMHEQLERRKRERPAGVNDPFAPLVPAPPGSGGAFAREGRVGVFRLHDSPHR